MKRILLLLLATALLLTGIWGGAYLCEFAQPWAAFPAFITGLLFSVGGFCLYGYTIENWRKLG